MRPKLSEKSLQKLYDQWWKERQCDSINLSLKEHLHRERLGVISRNNIATKLKKLFTNKSPTLLDIACGNGEFIIDAQKIGFQVKGVDISSVAIAQAPTSIKKLLQVASAEKLPFIKNSFDCVTCHGSLEHFTNQAQAIQEISRILKPHGIAYITVPNLMFIGHIYMNLRYGEMPNEAGQPEKSFTFQAWKNLLEKNGLQVINYQKYNDIFASNRVSFLTRVLWQKIFRHFVPVNLSYSFIFYCQRKS